MAREAVGAMRWKVNLDGIGDVMAKESSGGDVEIDVVEHRITNAAGNVVIHKIPGTTKYANVVIKRAVTDDPKFYQWVQACIQGKVEANRKNGTLTCFAPDNSPVATYSFTKAWVCKYKNPMADATKNEVLIEEIEMCVETCLRSS